MNAHSTGPDEFGRAPLNLCPKCGARLPEAAGASRKVTCDYCGTRATLPRVAPQAAAPPPAAQPLPPELANLPRPKVTTSSNLGGCFPIFFNIMWNLISFAFTIGVIAMAIQAHTTYDLLTREGLTTQAVVTRLEIDDSGDSTDYDVYYRYQADTSGFPQTHSDYESVSEEFYDTLKVGQKIDVVYAASQPGLSRIKSELHPPETWLFVGMTLFSLIFVAVGVLMLGGSLKDARRQAQLRRAGQLAQATVFDRWQDSDSDGDPLYVVAYAFRAILPDGSARLVTRAEYHKRVYQAVPPGGTLQVLYLPENPENCKIQRF